MKVFLKNKKLEKSKSFIVGDEIEIQWKTKLEGVFAWWHGIIDKVYSNEFVDIIFDHFPVTSRWYKFIRFFVLILNNFLFFNSVPVITNTPVAISPSGFVGAIRKLNNEEIEIRKKLDKIYSNC